VARVEQTYYLSVKRYTSGAFLRHKLGTELAKREVSSEILDPRAGAGLSERMSTSPPMPSWS
jgi:hypothetical protein